MFREPLSLPSLWISVLSASILAYLGRCLVSLIKKRSKSSSFPVANEAANGVSADEVRRRFLTNAQDEIREASRKYHDSPFYLIDEHGAKHLFLPPTLVARFKSDPRFSSREFFQFSLKTEFPGFEGVRPMTAEDGMFIATIRTRTTALLRGMTSELAEESKFTLTDLWSDSQDWHEIQVRESVLQAVARVSARVFLGPYACRHQEWLSLTIQYTLDVFEGARALCKYPELVARIVCLFQKNCVRLRQRTKKARDLLEDIGKNRAAQKSATFPDDWESPEFQLNFSVAAIHTTADLIHQTLLDIARHPSIIKELRKEVRHAEQNHGWSFQALQAMELLDSVMKETQRLKPVNLGTFVRYVREDVKLPPADSTGCSSAMIPKGTFVIGAMSQMWDESYYHNPREWDGHRFLKIRQNCERSRAQTASLVATSEAHMGFGAGTHACPGRFFAADEAKLILSRMLLDYDFRLVDGAAESMYAPVRIGLEMLANPEARLMVRRRAIG